VGPRDRSRTGSEGLGPAPTTGVLYPEPPTCSESLYRLSYPGPSVNIRPSKFYSNQIEDVQKWAGFYARPAVSGVRKTATEPATVRRHHMELYTRFHTIRQRNMQNTYSNTVTAPRTIWLSCGLFFTKLTLA
jgi:hypothetical protein